MLTKHRRRQPGVALRSVYQNRMADTLQPTRDLVLVLDHNSACTCVRVVKQLSDRIDGCTGNAHARQRVVPVCDRMLRDRGLDKTDGLLAMCDPIGVGPESGILNDRTQPRDGTKFTSQIIVRDADHDRAVGGFKGLIGTQRLVAGAALWRLNAALPIGLKIIAQQAHRGFEQRNLDCASLARFFSCVQ